MSNVYRKGRFPSSDDVPQEINGMIRNHVFEAKYSMQGHMVDQVVNRINLLTDIVAEIARLMTPEQQNELAIAYEWFNVDYDEGLEEFSSLEDLLS